MTLTSWIMMRRKWCPRGKTSYGFCLCLGLLLLAWGCAQPAKVDRRVTTTIQMADRTLAVEVANTAAQRARGLMFREKLGEDEGMLFVFPWEKPASFYMKHTHVPLSIAFIRADGRIANIECMEPLTLTSHRSRDRCLYALEVPQGWFARNGITEGDKVTIPPDVQASD